MSVRSSCLALLTAGLVFAVPSAAGADTMLGTVMPPAGSTATACPDEALGQLLVESDGAALNQTYTVPPVRQRERRVVVPKLGGASVALAKKVLPLLGCKVGKAKKAHSKAVAKGLLIGTSPGSGSHAVGTKVTLKVSSGPPPKRHKHKES